MITGLIVAESGGEALGATLAALVPGVITGLVGDAVIVARQPDASVATIAEGVGAKLVVPTNPFDPWRAGAAVARREWLLCLQEGDVLGEGWMRAVERFLATARGAEHGIGRLRRAAGSGVIVRELVERWTGTRTIRPGDLAHRAWLQAARPRRLRPVSVRACIERDAQYG